MEGTTVKTSSGEVRDDWSETASQGSQSQTLDPGALNQLARSTTTDTQWTDFSTAGDINTAAALRAQYAISIPKRERRRAKKEKATATRAVAELKKDEDEDESLVDDTAALTLHSKKTERLQRKQQRKSARLADYQASITTLLSLPSELLTETFTYLFPTDIASLRLTSRRLNVLTTTYESTIARVMIRRHYWTLYRCFPLPVPFDAVPQDAHAALLSTLRQEMLNIHRKSYHQHVQMIDPYEFCTCMTCVFAWNNLCLIVDLHHWQPHLENREPIPMIKRGSNPEWNQALLSRNADLVREAIKRPLIHARILQMHLDTITSTVLRNARWRHKLYHSSTSANNGAGTGPNGGKVPFHKHSSPARNTLFISSFSTSSSNPDAVVNGGHDSSAASWTDNRDIHANTTTTMNTPSTSISTPTSTQPAQQLSSSSSLSSSSFHSSSSIMTQKPNLYQLTEADVARGTDEFLDRSGPPSYDFPYMRDNYYSLEAYVPNRKWSSGDGGGGKSRGHQSGRWHFYALPPWQHERDLDWVRSWAVRQPRPREGTEAEQEQEQEWQRNYKM